LFVVFTGSRSNGNHSLNRVSFNIFFLYENLETLKPAIMQGKRVALAALAEVGRTFVYYLSQLHTTETIIHA